MLTASDSQGNYIVHLGTVTFKVSFSLLFEFRYNTFSPDVVKKMPKPDLVEEVMTSREFL